MGVRTLKWYIFGDIYRKKQLAIYLNVAVRRYGVMTASGIFFFFKDICSGHFSCTSGLVYDLIGCKIGKRCDMYRVWKLYLKRKPRFSYFFCNSLPVWEKNYFRTWKSQRVYLKTFIKRNNLISIKTWLWRDNTILTDSLIL